MNQAAALSSANTGGLDKQISEALDGITDFYLPADNAMDGFVYPTSASIRDFPFMFDFVAQLLEKCKERTAVSSENEEQYDEFVVRHMGFSYRGHKIHTIEKIYFALRRMPRVVPTLSDLGLDDALRQVLISPLLNKGGLVMICGETGQGKSTTCAATIKERMFKLGSFCLTVEDPPEMPLHGEHGNGRCLQTEVRSGGFAEAMRGAMRCYPTVSGSILYVGETRDAETAAEVLRIAMNGNLVFTTLHANDVSSGLKRLISLAQTRLGKEEANNIMASVFRVGVHQHLEAVKPLPGQKPKKKLVTKFLLSASHQTPVANKIRKSEVDSLGTDIQMQHAVLSRQGAGALLQLWKE